MTIPSLEKALEQTLDYLEKGSPKHSFTEVIRGGRAALAQAEKIDADRRIKETLIDYKLGRNDELTGYHGVIETLRRLYAQAAAGNAEAEKIIEKAVTPTWSPPPVDYGSSENPWYGFSGDKSPVDGEVWVRVHYRGEGRPSQKFHQARFVHWSSVDFYQVRNPPLDDGWALWNGGACPVEPNEYVDYRVKSGTVLYGVRAGSLYWMRSAPGDAIVAWRRHGR